MAESTITPISIGTWWGLAPDGAVDATLRGISAAVWSGEPDEVTAIPDPTTTIVAFALRDYDVEVFKDGRLVSNRRWKPGQCQVMEAGVHPRAVLKSPWRMLHLYLPQTLLDEAAADGRRPANYALRDPLGHADAQLSWLCTTVARHVLAHSETSRLNVEGLGCIAAAHLIERWSTVGRAVARQPALGRRDVQRVIDLVEARFADDLSLDELARESRLSPFQLLRAFKSATGKPPHRYQTELRLRRAQALLIQSEETVCAIAAAVGYADQGTLTRQFRQFLGLTPSEFRRQARR